MIFAFLHHSSTSHIFIEGLLGAKWWGDSAGLPALGQCPLPTSCVAVEGWAWHLELVALGLQPYLALYLFWDLRNLKLSQLFTCKGGTITELLTWTNLGTNMVPCGAFVTLLWIPVWGSLLVPLCWLDVSFSPGSGSIRCGVWEWQMWWL